MSWAQTQRVGLGLDRHRLASGRELRVGGVSIPADFGALGHSDGDVVLHALTDALLGALALGDIGELFPDSDPAIAGIDSAEILGVAAKRVREAGGRVVNVDVVVELEQPKLLPHRFEMRSRIAELLRIDIGAVFIKAKTGEGMGDIGEGRAIAATAVALVEVDTLDPGALATS